MHLLKASTLDLCEFFPPNIPEYAILSHRWGNGEVLYSDICGNAAATKPGFAKIKSCCDQALSAGLEFVWIDTCCIEKTSGAELSESINSMFRWYQDARVCYVYLSDVPSGASREQHEELNSFFRNSAWFSRGWTLQELLAPEFVVFYDQDWQELGTKISLKPLLSSITNIAMSFLTDFAAASVAQKMSWASQRNTSRLEDVAYCLLGIFEVYLTPIYGEGANAFRRLQLEIITKSDDQSIFAWTISTRTEGYSWKEARSVLASHPSLFAKCQDIVRTKTAPVRTSCSTTNRGLRLEDQILVPAEKLKAELRANTFVAVLNCSRVSNDECLGIYLRRGDADDAFLRTDFGRLAPCNQSLLRELRTHMPNVYFSLEDTPKENNGTLIQPVFNINATSVYLNGFKQTGHRQSAARTSPAYSLWRFHDPEQHEGLFVVADCVDTGVGVNIFTFIEHATWKQLHAELCVDGHDYKPKNSRRVDRLSRPLPSGRTASVALTIGRIQEQEAPRDIQRRHFVLKIVISRYENLQWPDQMVAQNSTSNTETQHLIGPSGLQERSGDDCKWPGDWIKFRGERIKLFKKLRVGP